MKYNVTNIDWDLEDDENTLQTSEIDLPNFVTINIDFDDYVEQPDINESIESINKYDNLVEIILNEITDTYGWCINNCNIKRVE